ncbi:hypothetical protein [Marinicella meishanensis]|uniref:hypothetical protein n=1 Tax=Marinicella meishanensis TaxID=2873263 RepID=UPI001CC0BB29|nr:hypothetical protein [Marinicella sp. NBU2979]
MKSQSSKLNKLFDNSTGLYKFKKTFKNTLDYIHEENWSGACHATTAILYVLLKEQGYDVIPCIGEVSNHPIIFDHSWIEYDDKVVDVAISNTLIENLNFPPVFLNIDLESELNTKSIYGYSGNGIDHTAYAISMMPIGEYMDNFSGHPHGLWGIAKMLAKKQSIRLNVSKSRVKYGGDRWVIRN